MVNDFFQGIQTFLDGEGEAMMNRADVIRGFLRSKQVRRSFQPDSKGVQTRPPGGTLFVVLYPHLRMPFRQSRGNRGIQSTRKQNTIWHVRHQVADHGIFQRVMQSLMISHGIFNRFVLHPVAPVPFLRLLLATAPVMPGRKFVDLVTHVHQRLHF